MEWYLHSYLGLEGKISFSYARSEWKVDRFCLHGVAVEQCLSSDVQIMAAKIDRLQVEFDQLFSAPRWVLHRPKITLAAPISLTQDTPFFDKLFPPFAVQIEEGELCLARRSQLASGKLKTTDSLTTSNQKHHQTTFFAVDIKGKEKVGSISLRAQNKQRNAQWEIKLSRQANTIACTFDQVDLAHFSEVGCFFIEDLKEQLTVSRGKLNGNLTLHWETPDQVNWAQGNLAVVDLGCELPKCGLEVAIQTLKWQQQAKRSEKKTVHPLFERFFPYLGGEGWIYQGSFVFYEPEKQEQWLIAEVEQGEFQLRSQSEPLIDLKGWLTRSPHQNLRQTLKSSQKQVAGKSTPFHLTAGGWAYGKDEWKMAFDLKAQSRRYEAMGAYFALSGRGDERYFAEFDCHGLTTDYFQALKYSLKKSFPQLSQLHLTSGTVDATLTGWINKNQLTQCEVRHFLARHCTIEWPKLQAKLFAAQLKGQGEFDLTKADFFEGGYWQFAADQGSIEVDKVKVLDQLSLQFAMRNRYIKPSQITASMGNIEATVQLEGLLSHLNIGIGVELMPADLSVFTSLKQAFALDLTAKIGIDADLRLRTMNQQIFLDGICDLLRVKGKNDRIEFGLQLDCIDLQLKETIWNQVKQMFCRGWFRADQLSSDTANLLLHLFEREWYGQGTLGAEGTFTPDTIELTIDPTHLTYCSPYVIADYPEAVKERALDCHFRYDVATKKWSGLIPLRGAQLRETSFDLLFDALTTDLQLEDGMLFSDQLEASAHRVFLSGSICVDYTPDTYAELNLSLAHFEGSVSDVREFLHHFDLEDAQNFSLTGKVISDEQGMQLRAYFGSVNALLDWEVSLRLEGGTCAPSPWIGCDQLAASLTYSKTREVLVCREVTGEVALKGGESPYCCHLNLPILTIDFTRDLGEFDFRLETACYDLCRFKGELKWSEEGLQVMINPHLSHSFGAIGNISTLQFDRAGALTRFDLAASLSALDVYHHLEFLSYAGVIPIKPTWLEKLQSPHFEGELAVAWHYHSGEEELSFVAQAEKLVLGQLHLGPFDIGGSRSGNCFTLEHCRVGSATLTATMEKEEKNWIIPHIHLLLGKRSILQVSSGKWDQENRQLQLPLQKLEIDIPSLARIFAFDPYNLSQLFLGPLSARGNVDIDFSQGIKKGRFDCMLDVNTTQVDQDALCLKSEQSFHLTFSACEGLALEKGSFYLFHPDRDLIWAKCSFDRLTFLPVLGEWRGAAIHVVIPPEMADFLAKTAPLSHKIVEESQVFPASFEWTNQIEASFNFTKGKQLKLLGRLAEGYYRLGKHLWECHDCFFSYLDRKLTFRTQTHYRSLPFEVGLELAFSPQLNAQLTVWEISPDGPLPRPLTIETGWNAQEGFFIQKLSGKSCGLDFSFHHNPKASLLNQMVLTGQVKIDVPALVAILPEKFQRAARDFGIGNGYELSGDFVVSKEELDRSHFVGYLKGKSFELLGSELETLLSEITIYPHQVEFTDFSVSDEAGICVAKHIRLEKYPDKQWSFSIPRLLIQDFRPSLLKKTGTYRGRIKPLTIRKLNGYHLRGVLDDPGTWTGRGALYFINTFKRHYNLLDIPFEIIGRLGLDMGLLIPVRGELKYCVADGKIAFTELSNSYSENKLSQFFLSSTRPSYIDFDGNIDVNIRMKQYVLLKFTELFTLSITGSFDSLRYSLR